MGATCNAAWTSFKLPNLKQRNQYPYPHSQNQTNEKKLYDLSQRIFNKNQSLTQNYRDLLVHLSQSNQLFLDSKFSIKGERLSKLQDVTRKQIKLYNNENKPGIFVFEQQNLQMTYLSAVLFYFCQQKQLLKQRILIIDSINQYQLYAFRLFCNGQEHNVIVDDIVSTSRQKLQYSVIRSKQLWPSLLQKAWCKMIGSYERAKGLSPEQCFEEITGIPAYSYSIQRFNQADIYTAMSDFLQNQYWLCAVANRQPEPLYAGQVFVITKIDDNQIFLESPFTDFTFQNSKRAGSEVKQSHYNEGFKSDLKSNGSIKMTFNKFRALFQYLIVGYSKKGYVPISKNVICKKRQQKFFQLYVDKKEDISIRFTQFYNAYIDDAQKDNYQYSPLSVFQLYDKNGNLLNFCQGCQRIHSGAHSTYLTKNIFHSLDKEKYFIRLQVDWEYEEFLKQGNLVVYASDKNVNLHQIQSSDLKQKIKKLHLSSLRMPNTVVIKDQNDQYELRFVQKKTNVVISVQNKSKQMLCLELSFALSKNFRVKYEKLRSDKTVLVVLNPQQIRFMELLPQDHRKQFLIQPFLVKKANVPIQ